MLTSSAGSTVGLPIGLPLLVSVSLARRRPARTRSRIMARSNSAVCGALHTAEFERELILARTGEGHARAKARGVHMGRPAPLTPHQQAEARKRRDNGETLMDIARTLRCVAHHDFAAVAAAAVLAGASAGAGALWPPHHRTLGARHRSFFGLIIAPDGATRGRFRSTSQILASPGQSRFLASAASVGQGHHKFNGEN